MITDSLGVGALPDAAKYGDQGADTFGNIVREMEAAGTPINMPNLLALGWGNIDGVCGGIAEYFNVDPTLIRLGVVLLSLMGFSGILAYIIAAIIIPRAPY
jgi:phage shock protein C